MFQSQYTQAASLVVCSKYKEIYMRILKSLNIVNLYRGMSKLKLKINVNLLSCCVLSFLWLYMANLSDLVGFALTVIRLRRHSSPSYNV